MESTLTIFLHIQHSNMWCVISDYRCLGPVRLGGTDSEHCHYLSRSTTSFRGRFSQSLSRYYREVSERYGQPGKWSRDSYFEYNARLEPQNSSAAVNIDDVMFLTGTANGSERADYSGEAGASWQQHNWAWNLSHDRTFVLHVGRWTSSKRKHLRKFPAFSSFFPPIYLSWAIEDISQSCKWYTFESIMLYKIVSRRSKKWLQRSKRIKGIFLPFLFLFPSRCQLTHL